MMENGTRLNQMAQTGYKNRLKHVAKQFQTVSGRGTKDQPTLSPRIGVKGLVSLEQMSKDQVVGPANPI